MEKKKKRGRPRKDATLDKIKPKRPPKEVTRVIKRSLRALAKCELLDDHTQQDRNMLAVTEAYFQLLLDNKHRLPTHKQVSEKTGLSMDTVRRLRKLASENIRDSSEFNEHRKIVSEALYTRVCQLALIGNSYHIIKLAAEMNGLIGSQPIIDQEVNNNNNTTIYKIVPTFPNSEKDVPEDPGIV